MHFQSKFSLKYPHLIEEGLQEVEKELLLRVRREDVVGGNGGAQEHLGNLKT